MYPNAMIFLSLVSFAQHIQGIIDKCSGITSNPIPQDVSSVWYKKCSHYKFSEKKICVFTPLYMQYDYKSVKLFSKQINSGH